MAKIKCPGCSKILTVTQQASTKGIVTCQCGKKLRLADSKSPPAVPATSSVPATPSKPVGSNVFTDIDFANLDIPQTTVQPVYPKQNTSEFKKSPYTNSYLVNAERELRKEATQDLQEYWWLQMYIKLNRALGIILAVIITIALVTFVIFGVLGSVNGLINGEFAQSLGLMIGLTIFVIIYGFLLFFYLTIWFAIGEFVAAILELTLNSRRLR